MTIQINKRHGAASILVTIILSIVVIGMIAGITLLSNQESRQASNTDQSNRALNGAQSTVQELAQKVAADPNYEMPACNSTGGSPSPGESPIPNTQDVAVTCATVVTSGSEMNGDIGADKTVQVDLSRIVNGAGPVKTVNIDWESRGDGNNDFTINDPLYPMTALYGNKVPATLEINKIAYGNIANPGAFNASDFVNGSLPMDTEVISPRAPLCKAAADPDYPNYFCRYSVNLSGYGSKSVVLRITARYKPTSYTMHFIGAGGNKVSVRFPHAIIDVTARSGQTYRRVQAQKPIKYTTFDFVSNVLYSGKNLCKTLQVYSNYEGAPAKLPDGTTNPYAGKNNNGCENP